MSKFEDLTGQQFTRLTVKCGDVIPCPPLLSTITGEQVLAKIELVDNDQVVYALYYFGILIGQCVVTAKGVTYKKVITEGVAK